MRSILLPQAFRAMLPALISQLVVVFKDTSLGFVILYPEVMRYAQIATQLPELRNPLQLYLIVGALFIMINYLLSKLAVWVERRISRARRIRSEPRDDAPGVTVPAPVNTGTAGG